MTIKVMGPARAHSTRLPGRGARRYPRDLTDAQWQVIAQHLPPERPGRRGRPRIWPRRRIIEAILYRDRTGCASLVLGCGRSGGGVIVCITSRGQCSSGASIGGLSMLITYFAGVLIHP